jgi:hypothetical protein
MVRTVIEFIIGLILITNVLNWNRRTSASSYSGGDVLSLTKHSVYCDSGEVLQGFDIAVSGSNIYFEYNCLKTASVLGSGTTRYTSWVSSGDMYVFKSNSAHRISDIAVICGINEALQGFQLKSRVTSILDTYDIQFQLSCVPVKAVKTYSGVTSRINGGFGGVEKLAPLSIDLTGYQALWAWRLNTDTDWSWSDFAYIKYFKYFYEVIELRNTEQEIINYEKDPTKPTI